MLPEKGYIVPRYYRFFHSSPYQKHIVQIIIMQFDDLLKIVKGTFIIFVNIIAAGPKPKQRHENSYKFPSDRNRTSYLESMCNGIVKYASFRSNLRI